MTVRLQKGAFFVPSQAVRILFTGGQDTFSQAVRIRLTKENFLIMINVKYEKTMTKRSTHNGTDREDFSC
jgi:dihydrofolate reductase